MSIRAVVLTAVLMTAAAGCADDPGITGPRGPSEEADEALGAAFFHGVRPLRVMSRNVYLGGDIAPILGASDASEIPLLVAQTWGSVQTTNFHQRAATIGREIALTRPDVIGLQEVALFRVQSPGDFLVGNPQAADEVAFDYLDILLGELERRGLHYEVATSIDNIDVELPAATSPTTFDDVRFTDRDVVLVHAGVRVDDAASGHYGVNVAFPVAGEVPITISRGWNRVDLTHRGSRYHFVNTHLETDETGATVQELQAQELIQMLGDVSVPTIVVGDLNGTPEGGTNMYSTMVEAGFEDLWETGTRPADPGFTCCFDPDLQAGELFERIDYVLARGPNGRRPHVGGIVLVGEGPFARTASGLRPADHAGIVASVSFPPPGFGEGEGGS